MKQVKFRAYYQFDGPTPNNPNATELSDEDVDHNLRMLQDDFKYSLDDNAKIEVTKEDYKSKQVWIMLTANSSTEELKAKIENVLGRNKLYGEILEE